MYSTVLYFLLFIILIYISVFSLENDAKEKQKQFKLLLVSIRALQIIQMVVIVLLVFDLFAYLVTGDFSIIRTQFINADVSSVLDYGEPILVTFSIVNSVIYLGIAQIVYQLVDDMKKNLHFNKDMILSIRLISRLFVVFVLVSFVASFVKTGVFTFRFDTVFYYALLIVLIRLFEQAVHVQEDSDLSI